MIEVPPSVLRQMIASARAAYPEECCGILCGRRLAVAGDPSAVAIELAVSVANVADADQRRTRYRIDPREILEVEQVTRQNAADIVGFYHSHPNHIAVPSQTDIAEAWPEYLYAIVSLAAANGAATCRIWHFVEGLPQEVLFAESLGE